MKTLRKYLLYFLLLIIGTPLWSQQRETFSMLSFVAPKGFTKEVYPQYISFVKFNNDKTNFCQVLVYQGIQAFGEPAVIFREQWVGNEPPQLFANECWIRHKLHTILSIHKNATKIPYQTTAEELFPPNSSNLLS